MSKLLLKSTSVCKKFALAPLRFSASLASRGTGDNRKGHFSENSDSLFATERIPWELVPTWKQYCTEQNLTNQIGQDKYSVNNSLNHKLGIWTMHLDISENIPQNQFIRSIGPFDEYDFVKLNQSYRKALDHCSGRKRIIAFPFISSTVFGKAAFQSAFVALNTTRRWLEEEGNTSKFDHVVCIVMDSKDMESYEKIILDCFPVNHVLTE